MGVEEIALLEEKIEALIGYIQKLTEEKKSLLEKLSQKDSEIETLKAELSRLQEERSLVKNKVGEILQKIEQLGLEGQSASPSELPLDMSGEGSSSPGF
ncbi:hypothetical protein Thein_1265 [Thermodesulfatator indicus DSM 15286]|uniref:Cell division protein ZapB n=1 Tax=Thermodesulfatator indicus (strain DSM 15286 / JCM 11887 / CIR29812) TaxID=667014 RepID=F8A8P2_THEID|nr:cell division protein ZapB [Thermodesulfatator indicus]AEH45133.1 hypothetical protein Thein_1265 [Thermodesulfatator indicus DSM 15286]